MILSSDTPSNHPRISKDEKEYIISSLPEAPPTKQPFPWSDVLLSAPFWAIMAGSFAHPWTVHLDMTELPQYLRFMFPDYMKDTTRAGIWLAVPYAVALFISFIAGFVSDYLIRYVFLYCCTNSIFFIFSEDKFAQQRW